MDEEERMENFISDLLLRAVADRASDIHIEPAGANIRIRFRIDGILKDQETLPIYDLERIIIKIKVLSNLDIATHSMPQDGHFEFMVELPTEAIKKKRNETPKRTHLTDAVSRLYSKTPVEHIQEEEGVSRERAEKTILDEGKRRLDIRVSAFPTIEGEAIVLRILNREEILLSLEELGMSQDVLQKVRNMITRPYGMVLVTGPSGSGKTTTLYAVLREILTSERNIITLEDPVELNLEGVRQVQINPDRQFDFAQGIRSILRQDPDAIMIGEIRDGETAENAIRTSLAGKIIYTTVHANTVIGTIARLIDMNIDRSLIAYAINGVISQRLVRKICTNCKIAYDPSGASRKYFGLEGYDTRYVKGKGCSECSGTGFRGRVGIFEVFAFDLDLRSLIVERSSMATLQDYVQRAGMISLIDDAREKILAGLTTAEEAMRAV